MEGLISVGGNLWIYHNNAITSLTGLEGLTSIMGALIVGGNYALNSLTGLNNVNSIGGDLVNVDNDALLNLIGLDNLTSIGGDLDISWNNNLTSLGGLENLISIGGDFKIYSNDALANLTGLDNVPTGSIENLNIQNNSALSNCAVQSICDYLAAPNGTVTINGNAPGCNSPEEVEEACLYISIPEINAEPDFNIYPSPVGDFATLSFEGEGPGTAKVMLYNSTGTRVKAWEFKITDNSQNDFVMDFSGLPAGMYCCRVQVGDKVRTGKMIKQ
jgi:hypothetical protein